MRYVPTTIVTGFLEAGKSSFIQKFLESDETNRYEHILLLVCEEGIVELCPERFKSDYVQIHYFDSANELSPERLTELAEKHRVNRVIVEFNGMWSLAEFVNVLPDCFNISEIISVIDAGTFGIYSMNLRTLMVDKLRFSHKVIVNRTPVEFDRDALNKLVAASASKARIYYLDSSGALNADRIISPICEGEIIQISDDTFSLMYREIFIEPEAFDGRRIQLSGRLIKDAHGNFAMGRYTMICCMADLVFSGLVCVGKLDFESHMGEWVTATGHIFVDYRKSYGQRGPVLDLSSLERTAAPTDEIILP